MSEERIAKLERELAKLKAKAEPPEPYKPKEPWAKYDPTEGLRMPASAVKAMCDVVPDMRGVAQEQKHGRSEPGWMPPTKSTPIPKGSGWAKPLEHGSPSGLRYVDQMCDVQDALDKRELQKRLRGL